MSANLGTIGRERTARLPFALADRFAVLAIVGPTLFAALIAFQDIVNWDWLTRVGWNPVAEAPVSDLAWTPIGALQMTNFFVFGCATLAFAALFHATVRRNRFTYPATLVFVLAGLALVASTARCDCGTPSGHAFLNPPSLAILGRIHNTAFYFVALPITLGAGLVWARLRKDPRFRQAARHSALQARIMIPLTVTIFSGPTLHFSTFYLWLLAWFAWQTHIAIRIRQVRRGGL